MKRRLAAVAAALGIALVAANPAAATPLGPKWDHRVVTVYVDYNVVVWSINVALADWSKASGVDLVLTRSYANADVRVHQRDLPAPSAGETLVTYIGTRIIHAEVTLDTTAIGLAPCSRSHIAAHELGHALGLAHNTTDRASLLYVGTGAACTTHPSAYDYADLKAMYP